MSGLFDLLDKDDIDEISEEELSIAEENLWDEDNQLKQAFHNLIDDLDEEQAESIAENILQAHDYMVLAELTGNFYQLQQVYNESGQIEVGYSWSLSQFSERVKLKELREHTSMPGHLQGPAQEISLEEIEAILEQPIPQKTDSSLAMSVELLESDAFDIKNHPLYYLYQKQVQISLQEDEDIQQEEQEEEGMLVLPPKRQRQQSSAYNYAIIDKTSPDLFERIVTNPPIQYPFELDPFQKRAVIHVHQNENVFVAAHTSAGKTLVAEWAIAQCMKRKTRVVYTSPIKALSNQKFHDFKKQFGDVGILTGDVVVNPEAFCLIMTTEILRSMLYNNSNKIRDLEWVILDEVHYVNDEERGVVWEEVLIMLPSYVKLIMLSATVPNAEAFSEWAGRVRKQKIYVQVTQHRPVPLEHSVFYKGDLYTVLKTDGEIAQNEYQVLWRKAQQDDAQSGNRDGRGGRGGRGRGRRARGRGGRGQGFNEEKQEMQAYKQLVEFLQEKDMLPCVIFSFSRDKCDKRASKLCVIKDLITSSERAKIKAFYNKSLKRINQEDRQIPQIKLIGEMLEHGIGVHHSGILPILKEIIEILFIKGLVKVLVATETVAMGLNMPARTVVFCEVRKFDGQDHRFLQPGEYTQMAGRAGRRGKDSKGNVIIFFKDPGKVPHIDTLLKTVKGKPEELQSKFQIRYSQITSLLLTETIDLDEMAKKSFKHNDTFKSLEQLKGNIPVLMHRKQVLEEKLAHIDSIPQFMNDFQRLLDLRRQCQSLDLRDMHKSGNMCEVVFQDNINRIAFAFRENQYIRFLVLQDNGQIDTVQGDDSNIIAFYNTNKRSLPSDRDYNKSSNRDELQSFVKRALNQPSFQPVGRLLPRGPQFKQLADQINEMLAGLIRHPLWRDVQREEYIKDMSELNQIQQQLAQSEGSWDTSDAVTELNGRILAMQEYGIINSEKIVKLKGRAVALMQNPYSLIMCELLFQGVFDRLSPEEVAALLTVFICDYPKEVNMKQISQELDDAYKITQQLCKNLIETEERLRVTASIKDKIPNAMINVTLQWTKGDPFANIMMSMPPMKEGNIVRCIIRTHELLKRLQDSAYIIGNTHARKKFAEASELLRRDIAFATSLYIT